MVTVRFSAEIWIPPTVDPFRAVATPDAPEVPLNQPELAGVAPAWDGYPKLLNRLSRQGELCFIFFHFGSYERALMLYIRFSTER